MKLNCMRVALLLIFFQGIPLAGMTTEASEAAAVEVVAHFQSVLLSIMRDADGLGFKGRFSLLEPEVKRSHDLPRIAQLTTGRYWQSLDKQQQFRFIDTFTQLVLATYAHQFHAYSGESFNRVSVQLLKRGRVLVRTELVKSNGKRVHLDYVLHHKSGRWLIINIIADGVSDLALKRVEYSTLLDQSGFDALLASLKEKIMQYE